MIFDYFDIHSHLYFPDYDTDREEVIQKMKDEKIGTITVGTDFESSQKCLELSLRHENIFACVGQHPGDVKEGSVFDERLNSLAVNQRVVAIGECGLDYFRIDKDNQKIKNIQKEIFRKHIKLALEVGKPLMLHVRSSKGSQDAYLDALEILEEEQKIYGGKLVGNAHFFAGDSDVLNRLLSLAFSVSFTGVITFTHDYDELIKATPIGSLMAETDAPFVAPVPYRGQRNSPLFVTEVVKRLSELKNMPLEETKNSLLENVKRVFGVAC